MEKAATPLLGPLANTQVLVCQWLPSVGDGGSMMKKLTIKMSLPMVRQRIKSSGMETFKEERLPNDKGTQIITIVGHVVNVYDNGSVYPDGKNPEQMRAILLRRK
jgi:hypothetical protein